MSFVTSQIGLIHSPAPKTVLLKYIQINKPGEKTPKGSLESCRVMPHLLPDQRKVLSDMSV